jgi:exoribonuclease R
MVAKKPKVGQDFEHVVKDILSKHNLRVGFPKRVERQVDDLCDASILSSSLVDMTNLPFITIDNDNSMDLDQAMYVMFS